VAVSMKTSREKRPYLPRPSRKYYLHPLPSSLLLQESLEFHTCCQHWHQHMLICKHLARPHGEYFANPRRDCRLVV
jgi:hypothetical protein